jgi:hypothetical protein
MATATAQRLIERASTILQDPDNTRWPENELLNWLNDGQREVALFKPDAYPKVDTVALDEGTRQSIPDGGSQLLDVLRNQGGGVVTLVSRSVMDEHRPDWHQVDSSAEVKHFMFDERNPKTFWVYPPNDGTGSVEVLYSAAPEDVAVEDTILIDDTYANALVDYILYRAYMKDADYAANDQRAANQYNRFLSSLGAMDQRETADNPHVRRTRPVVTGGE